MSALGNGPLRFGGFGQSGSWYSRMYSQSSKRLDGEYYCIGSPLSAMDLYGMGGQGTGKAKQQGSDSAYRNGVTQLHAVSNISDDLNKPASAKTTEAHSEYLVSEFVGTDDLMSSDVAPSNRLTIGASFAGNLAEFPSFLKKLAPRFITNPLGGKKKAGGNDYEIMLQGFNWESHKSDWYQTVMAQASWFSSIGFTMIWLPPPTESVSPQGYLPKDLYNLNSQYGTERELEMCVSLCQRLGMKVIGDIILNHRCATYQNHEGVWNQFGGVLDWDARAILGNDPNFRGLGNHGHGMMFHAAPNIDHSQKFVQQDINVWLKWLRKVGFDGWRLDFVRGFEGKYIKGYVEASNPKFAVGEFWDCMDYEEDGSLSYKQDSHRQRICDWINSTGDLSTAFDITTKGILHAVFERSEYWRLRDEQGKPPGLLGWWPSQAVTFIENHDTGSTQGHWRFPDHGVEQGYVYILTHPGIPTVFYDHLVLWQEVRNVILKVLQIRKRIGINARSTVNIVEASQDVYSAEIDSKLLMKIGPGQVSVHESWHLTDCGHNWAIWEKAHH